MNCPDSVFCICTSLPGDTGDSVTHLTLYHSTWTDRRTEEEKERTQVFVPSFLYLACNNRHHARGNAKPLSTIWIYLGSISFEIQCFFISEHYEGSAFGASAETCFGSRFWSAAEIDPAISAVQQSHGRSGYEGFVHLVNPNIQSTRITDIKYASLNKRFHACYKKCHTFITSRIVLVQPFLSLLFFSSLANLFQSVSHTGKGHNSPGDIWAMRSKVQL